MSDELDLVRSFRSDIPGPSTDAWARARAAVGEASGSTRRRAEDGPRRRRRWPLTLSGLGAAVGGTAALVSVLVPGGSRAAFAGWSSTPSYLTAAQTAATQANCRANLPTALAEGSWSQVATDARGPYTMGVYQSGNTLASCFIGPSFSTVQAESLASAGGGMAVSVPGGSSPTPGSSPGARFLSGGDIEQLLVSRFSQAGVGPYTLAEGRLGPGVGAVTLVLSDGQDVTATTGSGWLVAWWPGSEGVSAAQITSASGTTTVHLNNVPLPTPPPSDGSPRSTTPVPVGNGTAGTRSGNGGG